jgi:hypothetical protein
LLLVNLDLLVNLSLLGLLEVLLMKVLEVPVVQFLLDFLGLQLLLGLLVLLNLLGLLGHQLHL